MRVLNDPRLALILCPLLLLAFAYISASAILTKSPTMDESLHAVSAYGNRFEGDFHINPEDPPLWKYWAMLPQRRSDVNLSRDNSDFAKIFDDVERQLWFCASTLYRNPPTDGVAFINRSRLAMLAFPVALGALLMAWSWKLAGPAACLVAGVLFCLDPNFLAHGPLIKNDVAISLGMFGLAFAVHLLGERVTLARLLAATLICAIGPAVKFSGVLFLPLLSLMLLIRALLPEQWKAFTRELTTRWQRLGAAFVICTIAALFTWGVIWAAYGFRFTPTSNPSRHLNFDPQVSLAVKNGFYAKHHVWPSPQETQSLREPLPVRAILLARNHRLLPESWLFGLLFTYQSSLVRPTYLLGQVRWTGSWHYFPLAMLFKTPLATLAALVGAWLFGIVSLRRFSRSFAWPLACALIPIVVYGATALSANLNLGLRHVLPLYPFLFLLISLAFAQALALKPRITAIVAPALALALSLETLSAYPNFISFFNAGVGGPTYGVALLGDSNLDWGQDLPALARWQRAHPNEKLYLCYFGSADPRVYGIRYTNLPSGYFLEQYAEMPASPGVIAVSATKLQGLYVYENVAGFYAPLYEVPPREVLNGTIYLFDFPLKH